MKRHAQTRPRLHGVLSLSGTLTSQNPSRVQSDPVSRVGRSVLIAIGITLFAAPSAAAPDDVKRLTIKEYAAVLVDDKYQMSCLSKLYGKESAWNYKARSGSHYGIPQGRSEYLRDALPEQQIMWGLKYIHNRYGTPCKAWEFFQRNNYH